MSPLDAIQELIRARRTVKPPLFSAERIDDAVIEELLEAANWAPTHGKTEPWRFKVYTDEGRKLLAETLGSLYTSTTAETDFKPAKLEKATGNAMLSSHAIAVFAEVGINPKVPELEDIEATACALQNLQLAARAQGIGSFWSTGPMTYLPEARAAFGVPDTWRYLGVIYLGIPKSKFPESRRGSVADKTDWIRST